MAGWWVGISFGYLAVISVVLTVIDVRSRRLPNRIVLPSYAVAGVLFTLACLTGAPWSSLTRAGIGAAVLFLFYALFRLIDRRWVGGGDVKLAGVLGGYLAWLGWDTLIIGAAAAFMCGGVWAVALLMRRKANRSTRLAFGPWMILGTWIAIALGIA